MEDNVGETTSNLCIQKVPQKAGVLIGCRPNWDALMYFSGRQRTLAALLKCTFFHFEARRLTRLENAFTANVCFFRLHKLSNCGLILSFSRTFG